MEYKPHKYQQQAIKLLIKQACAGLFLSPGLGKTSIVLSALNILKSKGYVKRTLVIAPLRVCYNVWPSEGIKWDNFNHFKFALLHGPQKELALGSEADIYLINPEGLEWLFKAERWRHVRDKFDALVVDECFPAGTPVLTEHGYKAIETIQPETLVKTSSGYRPVLRKGKRQTNELVTVRLENEQEIRVTPEHPFFTDLGWVPAKSLQGRRVYYLWEADQHIREAEQRVSPVLQQILWEETDVCNTAEATDGGKSTHERDSGTGMEQRRTYGRGNQEKTIADSEGAGPHVWEKGGQRDGADQARAITEDCATPGLRLGICGAIGEEAARLSHLLQAGLWEPNTKDWCGGRWKQPQTPIATSEGQEKSSQAEGVRVESVTNNELGSGQDVWNLEVGGCPHFVVRGLLVHNSTKFKHTRTSRFKTLKQFLGKFKRRYILTGTPAPNGIMDLFGQMYLLDEGNSLGRYITHYRNTFFYPTGYGGYTWVPRIDAMERITERISPLVLQMQAADYLELPELIHTNLECDLPEDARAVYHAMEEDFYVELGDKEFIALNAAAAGVKCRQVANGALYGAQVEHRASKREVQEIHPAKLEVLEDLIEELSGQPLLLLYEFQHDADRIRAWLKKDIPVISELSAKKSMPVINAFNAGELPILLGHPASMGHGLNLQGSCHHVCFFGIPWDLELYDQAIQRVHRQGQKAEHTFVYHIVARNTLDGKVLRVLQGKAKTQAKLLKALKDRQ